MAERPPINPFANLTADPTLARMAASSGDNLSRMRQGLAMQQLQNTGAMDRTNATNINNMKMEGLRQMLPLVAQSGNANAPETMKALNSMFGAKRALTIGQAMNQARSGGYSVADPTQKFTIDKFPGLNLQGGFPTKQASAELAKNKINDQVVNEELVLGGKPVGGISKRKSTQGVTSTNTSGAKGAGKIASQKALINQATSFLNTDPQFKGKKITNIRMHKSGRVIAEIDDKLHFITD